MISFSSSELVILGLMCDGFDANGQILDSWKIFYGLRASTMSVCRMMLEGLVAYKTPHNILQWVNPHK